MCSAQLGKISLTELPSDLFLLENVATLWLNDNKLVSLPREIAQLKRLVWLAANGNQLSSLPNEIGQLTKLERLVVRHLFVLDRAS